MRGRRLRKRERTRERSEILVALAVALLATAGTVEAGGVPERAIDGDGYRAIVERPLFRPGRRPEPAPLVEAAAAPFDPAPEPATVYPELEFLGTVERNGRIIALVALPGRAEPLRLTVGSDIEGWRVTRVEPTRLVIESETAYEEYTILE